MAAESPKLSRKEFAGAHAEVHLQLLKAQANCGTTNGLKPSPPTLQPLTVEQLSLPCCSANTSGDLSSLLPLVAGGGAQHSPSSQMKRNKAERGRPLTIFRFAEETKHASIDVQRTQQFKRFFDFSKETNHSIRMYFTALGI